ncbi:MAG: hypothetical protein QXE18_02005 [Thermoplasmata archaeon]
MPGGESRMGDDTRENNESARILLQEIARLGFEVGYLGHLEGIGWVSKKLKELEAKSAKLGILEQAKEKYSLAKELGKKRRHQTNPQSGPSPLTPPAKPSPPPTELERAPPILRLRPEGEGRYDRLLRVQPSDGILALANLLKVAESSHWVTRQLDIAFSGIADLHDLLSSVKEEGSAETILRDGLEKLKRAGWISEYRIEEVNNAAKTAKISAVSMIPEQYGMGSNPVCKNISLALESIGLRAFKSPVHAFEKRCICQGEDHCGFVILPRAEENGKEEGEG